MNNEQESCGREWHFDYCRIDESKVGVVIKERNYPGPDVIENVSVVKYDDGCFHIMGTEVTYVHDRFNNLKLYEYEKEAYEVVTEKKYIWFGPEKKVKRLKRDTWLRTTKRYRVELKVFGNVVIKT